jgi:hypothetical protein
MNATPTGGTAVPPSGGRDPSADEEPSSVPLPRSLPRRARVRERVPERRRPGAPDEATLHRLLTGLREI